MTSSHTKSEERMKFLRIGDLL